MTVQEGWVDYNDMNYDKVGNIQLTRIMGGDVRVDPAGFDIGVRDSWKRALESVVEAGGKPYPIPAGASDHPLGGLGFANWAVEVEAQEAELDDVLRHDHRVHGHRLEPCRDDRRLRAVRSAGTARDRHRRVGDARADRRSGDAHRHRHRERRSGSIDRYATTRSRSWPATRARPTAYPTRSTVDAIHLAARTEGMLTDPVYEGKSMAGLIGMIRSGEIPRRLAGAVLPPRRSARAPRLRRLPRPRFARTRALALTGVGDVAPTFGRCRISGSPRRPSGSRRRRHQTGATTGMPGAVAASARWLPWS